MLLLVPKEFFIDNENPNNLKKIKLSQIIK